MLISRMLQGWISSSSKLMVDGRLGEFSVQLLCSRLCSGVSVVSRKSPRPGHSYLTGRLNPGFPISFGVFQEYYSKLPEFKNNPYIPLVGTMASGIPYLGSPFMAVLVRRYQRLSTAHLLDRLAVMYSRACRRFFCKQSRRSHRKSRYHVRW